MSDFVASKTDAELRDMFDCYYIAQDEHLRALALNNHKYVDLAHDRASDKMAEDPDYCPVYEYLFEEMLCEVAVNDSSMCDMAHKHGLLVVCKLFSCEIYDAEEIVERF